MRNLIRIIVTLIVAATASSLVTLVVAATSESFGWAYFTGWGLAHGTIFFVFPLLMTIFVILFRKLGEKK